MTRRKVTHYNTTPVTLGDIEKRIRDITSKPSFSTCEISYEVLKKMTNIVRKKTILHMTNKSMKPGHYPDPSKHGHGTTFQGRNKRKR